MASRLPSIEDRTYAFAVNLIRTCRTRPPRDAAEKIVWYPLLKSEVALKEMRERHFWLRLLRDSDEQSHGVALDSLRDESGQLVAILTAAVKSARANDQRGSG
jgi:hypothetical protein